MVDHLSGGHLERVLLPLTFGTHQSQGTEFTVLAVEIWNTGIVVNLHLASVNEDVPHNPEIVVHDHFGTEYKLDEVATVGSRQLQFFAPSIPEGTRSLTIRSVDDPDSASFVVALAVPAANGRGGETVHGHVRRLPARREGLPPSEQQAS
ncbi:hypothetical protein [Arthrobacter sp. ISL-65]|uniref:hypothetical protein n=1 Tax=Arthrobacter sp. ISL-65 TaxID=2819112 RepID=UPI001BE61A87|nr:hypothetical protein [Arthrobacter sp. ISL-65]MBT2551086.1 hypothetical protein [Arthrobacter sp. ISL-65]